jgi:DNA-3-methyladenine glycosylase I
LPDITEFRDARFPEIVDDADNGGSSRLGSDRRASEGARRRTSDALRFTAVTAVSTAVVLGDDGFARCAWGAAPEEYRAYHDDEWGRPVVDDTRLFEKLCLEGFQSGLSWLTILRKRPAFRAAFAGFDIPTVARFGSGDVDRLLQDAGIIRHRGKITAAIANAQAALEVQAAEGSLAALLWRFEPRGRRAAPATLADIPAVTPESEAMARELRRRGFRFIGPTTAYAAMQSLGLVNDHVRRCHARAAAEEARRALVRPSS